MDRKFTLGIFAILLALAGCTVWAINNVDVRLNFLGIVFIFALYIGPAWIGEESFDFVDKVLDARINPDSNLRYFWHIFYSVALGVIMYGTWLILAPVLVETDASMFGAWLHYHQHLDTTVNPAGFPAFAYGYAQHALVASIVFYHYEAVMNRWVAPKLMKLAWFRRFLSALTS